MEGKIDAFKQVVHNHSQSLFPPNTLDINDLKRQFIKYSSMNSVSCFCLGQHSPWRGTGTTPPKAATADKSNITALSDTVSSSTECVLWLWRSVLYLETVHGWKLQSLIYSPIKVDERWKWHTAVVLEFVHNPEKHFIAFLIRIQLPSQPNIWASCEMHHHLSAKANCPWQIMFRKVAGAGWFSSVRDIPQVSLAAGLFLIPAHGELHKKKQQKKGR